MMEVDAVLDRVDEICALMNRCSLNEEVQQLDEDEEMEEASVSAPPAPRNAAPAEADVGPEAAAPGQPETMAGGAAQPPAAQPPPGLYAAISSILFSAAAVAAARAAEP
ncbi:hypothetical protein QAD02_021361 [Eretmocerus hayati]|uniref:Uncharacterized protein n=1 Tax=Eretmocerus hayati TaxID=131215 RepID=A0ACC2PQ20_9HYME|nr:hypothetical protein QAD02_021361 [Eretmocerus hayati]